MDYLKIGKKLKSVREKKGLSLHQIFEVTRIQPSILTEIETGQFQKSEIFLKNFIKTYCEALGLNFKKLMELEGGQGDSSMEDLEEPDKLESHFFKQNKNRLKMGAFSALALIFLFLAFQFIPLFIKSSKTTQEADVTQADSIKAETTGQAKDKIDGQDLLSEEEIQKESILSNEQASPLSSLDKSLWPRLKSSSFDHEVMIQSSEKLTLYFKADKASVLTKELAPLEWFVIKAKEFIYIRLDEIKTETQIFYNGQKIETDSLKFFENTFQ